MKLNKHTLYSDDLLNILPEGVLVLNSEGEVLLLNQQARMELQTKVLDNNTFKSCHIDEKAVTHYLTVLSFKKK